ncbi:right-handed parallel beta-helix repeat-containing protein [Pedobacter sp. ASV28]|uniref:right-handed parallel beta-helix repeat-containing protein n=1 Tax=Pedobacter sp. ASV28 TaxID=2795123 RepID=UPI0018EC1C88|nr:right-handed parallel beta-helix repeat-containing protein [Pedobacter sp. ASV28]
MRQIKLFLLLSILSIFFVACNKEENITFDPSAKLNFSTDSVLFDTVFTSIGSTVRRFKVFNYNTKAINIEEIKINGGSNSPFSINVNGKQVIETKNLVINGKDSINILVKVNINPTGQNQPFIVQDSILLFFNGKKEKIPLVAYGQNAIFVKNATINNNTIWDSNLPYIIYNSVTVAENTTLTINPGTRVLFHSGSIMNVKGTLIANGSLKDSILFASDRTERIYEDEPGQWNGIHFHSSSKNSIIGHTILKNAIAGITVDSLSSNNNPKLTLVNSIIKNMQVVGFLGYHTDLAAFNNLFFNCGQYLIYGVGGGNYNLKQNTFGAYNYNFARRTPAINLSDFISTNEFAPLNAEIINNIIWGSLDEEFSIEKKSSAISTIEVKNNLIKTKLNIYTGNGNILNVDPLFLNPRRGIFKLDATSPALKKGLNLSSDRYFSAYLSKDILAKERLFPSDLGCYQHN